MSALGADPLRRAPSGRRGSVDRALGLALGAWASAVFLLLWAGAVAVVAGNEALLTTLWEGLRGLEGLALIAAWILFLPVGVALWAANADLSPPVAILVVAGLVAWTAAAWAGLARALADRRL